MSPGRQRRALLPRSINGSWGFDPIGPLGRRSKLTSGSLYSPEFAAFGAINKLMLEPPGAGGMPTKLEMFTAAIETLRGWLMIITAFDGTPSSSIYLSWAWLSSTLTARKMPVFGRGFLDVCAEAEYERHGDVQTGFPAAIPWRPMADPSISTMVPPIRALRCARQYSQSSGLAGRQMAIPNILTTPATQVTFGLCLRHIPRYELAEIDGS